MGRAKLLLALSLVFCIHPVAGLAYNPCADVDQTGTVDVGDVVYMLDAFGDGPPLADGTGDIDYRQGHNLGDFRYLCNYIFAGWDEGGCPPFPDYEILTCDDTVIVPTGEIPAGTGSIGFPVTLVNRDTIFDLMIPMTVLGIDSNDTEVSFVPSEIQYIPFVRDLGATKIIYVSTDLIPTGSIKPGIHTLGILTFDYVSSPGATFTVDTSPLSGDSRFLHCVYGQTGAVEIGAPTAIASDVSPYPTMSVEPDTLFFSTLTSIPITEPDTFTVITDGNLFNWTLTHPAWLEVDPTEGISGTEVSVLPVIDGLSVGVHYGTITVSSTEAIGSPQEVIVELELKQTYPSFDANCDGTFDIDDLVVLVMYMFAGGDPPCDPCAAE